MAPSTTKPKRTGRANSKKAAPSSAADMKASAADAPLFEIDTTGSSTVRHALLADAGPATARLRKGQSFKKPLRSDQILAARSSVPALSSRAQPASEVQARKQAEKRYKVDRETKERLKRIVGRDGQGEGLWGVKGHQSRGELTAAMKSAGEYDAWEVDEAEANKTGEEDMTMEAAIARHTNKKAKPKVSTICASWA